MTVNNTYSASMNNLRSLYNLGKDGGKTDLKKSLHEALSNNKNVLFIEDKVSVSSKISENEIGTDEWLDKVLEDLKKQEEQSELNGILNKLYTGAELSAGELDLLREKAPELYKIAMEARQMEKDIENKLKNCRSKDEAERIKMNAMQNVAYRCGGNSSGSNIPESQQIRARILFASVNKVFREFYESEDYAMLPQKTEEEKKREKSGVSSII